MSTTTDRLSMLVNTKADIKAALTEKGASPSDVFSTYGDEIRNLAGEPASVAPKEVNFYDYDGTILYAYTVEEMLALTDLPPLPSHKGLICQGWNWTLAGLQAAPCPMNVGASYVTDDGKTRLYIRLPTEATLDTTLCIYQSVDNGVSVDWGDGSVETFDGVGYVYCRHTYDARGDYTVSLDPAEGCELGFGRNHASYCVMAGVANSRTAYRDALYKVELGRGVATITDHSFRACLLLETITIPVGVLTIGANAFRGDTSLASAIIPMGATVGDSAYSFTSNLRVISLPEDITAIDVQAFYTSTRGQYVGVPGGVPTIFGTTFANNYGVTVYDFSRYTTVPTLGDASAFNNMQAYCKIYVPAALEEEWKAATNWASYADYIVGV